MVHSISTGMGSNVHVRIERTVIGAHLCCIGVHRQVGQCLGRGLHVCTKCLS